MIKITELNGEVRYLTSQQFSEYKKIFREYNPSRGYTPDKEIKND